MGKLKEWLDEDWVRIDSSGNIAGPCGSSKDKKNPDRCLPRSKAQSLSKGQRASTARKKKREGSKGKTVVANTKAAKVAKAKNGGVVVGAPYRKLNKGCGAVLSNRRKRTLYT
jgi:hypothetical protein|tara:strand:- start:1547 stop:1885 length:339 start_codon:yes stop_codon:yes gene_type:complete